MADKNNNESVRKADAHDMREHFAFACAIAAAMRNNCPTAEWRSWKYVPGNVNKLVMDELLVRILLMDQ